MPQSLIQETQPALRRADLNPDPVRQFERWFAAAEDTVPDREAFALTTVSPEGRPSTRMVLLRGLSEQLVFYTNYTSAKAKDIDATPEVGVLFFWPTVYRQVRMQGHAQRIPAEQSAAYFRSRPRGSQIGAWASRQSSIVADRQALEQRYRELEDEFAGRDVPVPDFWGGYAVKPDRVEFWQGQPNRMHDRFVYRRHDGGWSIDRLAP